MPERSRDQPSNLDDLEPAFTATSTEERIFNLLVELTEPTSATEVADELDCSKDTARKYLDWFSELGIARKHEGRPVAYERNEEYFEWQYVTRLADTHTLDELRANLVELRDQLAELRDRYDADRPEHVSVVEAVERLDAEIEDVWDDLSAWAGIADEIRLHDRARQRHSRRTEARA